MLKVINNMDLSSLKCAEILCHGRKGFFIACSSCNMKTLDYNDFIGHFRDFHDAMLEAKQELPEGAHRSISSRVIGSLSILEDNEDEICSIELNSRNAVDELSNYTAFTQVECDVMSDDNNHPLSNLKSCIERDLKKDLSVEPKEVIKGEALYKLKSLDKPIGLRKSKQQNEQLKCPICGIYRNNKYNLQTHINSHTGARPYSCQQCAKSFTNSGNLWKHIELVHKGIRSHKCAKCNQKFQYKSQAKRHEQRVHLKVQPFSCDTCEKSYCTKKELADHILKHSLMPMPNDGAATTTSHEISPDPKNKFVCEHCGKTFAKYSGIWAHRRIHNKVQRYTCSVCNKSMYTSYHLKEHMNTHTGERPHKCEVCGKAFQQRKFLREHVRIHAVVKAFVCEICSKKFSQAAGLYSHTRTHKKLLK